MNFIRSFAARMGVDRSIFYTSLTRIIQAGGGVISILFVVRYLTDVEQGFYYTFGSIIALQVFFELGLNGIITQYVAHEVSHLHWKDGVSLEGDRKYQSRLSSLLHFSMRWYSFFVILLITVLVLVGFIFFTKYQGEHDNVTWRLPWLVLVAGTALNLFIAPIMAFMEGLGKVKEVAKIRLGQQIFCILAVWGGLTLGAELYTLGLHSFVGMTVLLLGLLCSDFRKIIINIWKIDIRESVSYRREIFPYQWKIALSWVSSYFIFQMFNPVLFATEGAIVAGQMGMTLAALNGIQAFAMSWMTTKVPLYSGLIARRQYSSLDLIFSKTLKQSVFILIVTLTTMLFVVYLVKYFHVRINGLDLGDRFLGYWPMILMIIPLIVNQFVNSWALYLRCHKQEPFLINSLVAGILCCLSTILLGKWWGVMGITGGYCLITVVMSFWGYWIFKTKKKIWHQAVLDDGTI